VALELKVERRRKLGEDIRTSVPGSREGKCKHAETGASSACSRD
jgi:hypothetical protein